MEKFKETALKSPRSAIMIIPAIAEIRIGGISFMENLPEEITKNNPMVIAARQGSTVKDETRLSPKGKKTPATIPITMGTGIKSIPFLATPVKLITVITIPVTSTTA
jgi:hypothetical protein